MEIIKMKKIFMILPLLTILISCGSSTTLPTAENVNVGRYAGKWFTIAALPKFFTRKCVGQTAEYKVINKNTISVLNSCIKKDGRLKTIDGQATVTNKSTNAELEVKFNNFWTKLFRAKGEYIIIKLDENYEYVMVGTSNRKSLWIMSRETYMPEAILNEYVALATNLGFKTEKLKYSTRF